jgi:hypothetical protein
MLKGRLTLAAGLVLLLFVGCGKLGPGSVVGRWRGKTVTGYGSDLESERRVLRQVEEQARQFSMEFNSDGTGTANSGGWVYGGTYVIAGNKTTFTLNADQPNVPPGTVPPSQKPLVFILSNDSRSLTLEDSQHSKYQMVLERLP